jgi:hypothetical protein
MMKRSYLSAVGVSAALVASGVSAAENPFQMIDFGSSSLLVADARDMQGNEVKINPETGFSFGGDQAAAYANGKLGTGVKDPAVCGTFSGSSCSVPHLKKEQP